MESIILNVLLLLDYIAFGFCWVRYMKKETIKSAIGWAITSAIVCVLNIIFFIIAESNLQYMYITNFCIYIINFGLAIYAIRRCKNK